MSCEVNFWTYSWLTRDTLLLTRIKLSARCLAVTNFMSWTNMPAHLWLDQYDEKKREPHMEWRCLLDQWFTRSSLLQVTSQVNACPAVRLQIKPRKRRKQMERLSGFFFLLFYLLDLLLLLVYTHMSLTGLNHKWNRYRFIKKPLVFQPPVGH